MRPEQLLFKRRLEGIPLKNISACGRRSLTCQNQTRFTVALLGIRQCWSLGKKNALRSCSTSRRRISCKYDCAPGRGIPALGHLAATLFKPEKAFAHRLDSRRCLNSKVNSNPEPCVSLFRATNQYSDYQNGLCATGKRR